MAAIPVGTSQEESSHPIVNLVVDVSATSPASQEQAMAERENLKNIYNALLGTPSTMFLTKNVSSSQIALYITQLGLYGNFEFGMSGNDSDEKLSSMSYEDQKAILKSSKEYAESCHVCGENSMPILGFRPQSYDQDQDTYRVLDEMGIEYNVGFQSGLIFEPGHDQDVWPYTVEGYNFYAVPVSTYNLSGEKLVLQDSYFKEDGLSGSQWYDALVGKLSEIQGKDEPLVIVLTAPVSGSGDYLDALNNFIAYAKSKNASFVTSKQLVDMAKLGVRDVSALPGVPECKTCGNDGSSINTETSNIDAENIISVTGNTSQQIANASEEKS